MFYFRDKIIMTVFISYLLMFHIFYIFDIDEDFQNYHMDSYSFMSHTFFFIYKDQEGIA